MSRQLLPIYFERDPTVWVQSELPAIKIRAVAQIESATFLVLLSKPDAVSLTRHLVTDLCPPFNRRQWGTTGAYAPGVAFTLDEETGVNTQLREKLLDAHGHMMSKLDDEEDKHFLCQKINLIKSGQGVDRLFDV